jgi:hypothetical protein
MLAVFGGPKSPEGFAPTPNTETPALRRSQHFGVVVSRREHGGIGSPDPEPSLAPLCARRSTNARRVGSRYHAAPHGQQDRALGIAIEPEQATN